MSELAPEKFICGVCRKPIDPQVDIYLQAAGLPLFPVHAGVCRETVTKGVVASRDLLEARYPAVRVLRGIVTEVFKQINARREQQHDDSPNVQPPRSTANSRRPRARTSG